MDDLPEMNQKFSETLSVAGFHLFMAFILGIAFGILIAAVAARGVAEHSHAALFAEGYDVVGYVTIGLMVVAFVGIAGVVVGIIGFLHK